MPAQTQPTPAIIIGAGPAGLAAAACLRAQDIDYRLLERGAVPLDAMRRIDPAMKLLSPTRLSRLPGMRLERGAPAHQTFAQLVTRLDDYRQARELQVDTRSSVTAVRWTGDGFVVQFTDAAGNERELSGSNVINATGMISSPALPSDFDPAACTLRWQHSLDTRQDDLERARHVLVIGGGPSASAVLETWLKVRRPQDRATLSLRTRMRALRNPLLGVDIHYWAWLPEHVPTRLLGHQAGRFREPMPNTTVVDAVARGLIQQAPGVRTYEASGVRLDSDELVQPDLLVFATGFRYGAEHLRGVLAFAADGRPIIQRCESTVTRGLFVLGYRYGRTLASPYLRGISRDAAWIAARIAARSGR